MSVKNAYKILVGNLKGRDHSEDLGVGGKITLEGILGKQWEIRIGYIWLRIGISGGICEHSNEPSIFMKDGEFVDYLSDC
jgi:hypothetical protein